MPISRWTDKQAVVYIHGKEFDVDKRQSNYAKQEKADTPSPK